MSRLTKSQRDAISARGNVIVVAGAGTGKTSTLVERCLALIQDGCSLENILMVTFTDAAASEMRSRIREALSERAKELEAIGRAGSPESLPQPEIGAQSIALRAEQCSALRFKEHFEKQIALLDVANISTLHSFCLQLVREHFYELEIDPDVTVLDE